ncbi:MAG: hypothetical protein RSC24_06335 [Clostridium sp.]
MEFKLFTVYLKENGTTNVEVNEDVINAYGISLEELQEKIKLDNLYQGIKDFCEPLK